MMEGWTPELIAAHKALYSIHHCQECGDDLPLNRRIRLMDSGIILCYPCVKTWLEENKPELLEKFENDFEKKQ
jgi:hypothetical protein